MPAITVTITDRTQSPRSIGDLAVNGTGSGYTVVGSYASLNPGVSVQYLSIQASYGNSGTTVYKGDSKVLNDGTRQGKELGAGDTDVMQLPGYCANLNTIFLTSSANSAKINIEWHLG